MISPDEFKMISTGTQAVLEVAKRPEARDTEDTLLVSLTYAEAMLVIQATSVMAVAVDDDDVQDLVAGLNLKLDELIGAQKIEDED